MEPNRRFIRPHYLKPNEASKTPRRWIFFDTESQAVKTKTGEVQTFSIAQAVFDNEGKNGKPGHTSTWATFFDPEDLWGWIESKAIRKHRLVVMAHNLSYDIRISQAFRILTAHGWKCDWIRLDSANTAAHFTKDGASIQMADLMSYLPTSLKEIGRMIGLPKLDTPPNISTQLSWLAYCKRDVEILQAAYWRILDFHRSQGLGNWHPTGSGMAFAAWRHRFHEEGISVGADEETRKNERSANWTGRCEVWKHGTYRDGPYTEWDFELAYGRVSAECKLPVLPLGYMLEPSLPNIRKIFPSTAVLAKVKVTIDRPLVPTHDGKGIYWPIGSFETTLWTPELLLLEENGAQVEFIWARAYRATFALKRFQEWLIGLATGNEMEADPLVRCLAHSWTRTIVGRLGMRYHSWDKWATNSTSECQILEGSNLDSGEPYRLMLIGRDILKESELLDYADGSTAIMGYVMSEMRARLWHAMELAGFDHVYYVDTDSLLLDAEGSKNIRQAIEEGKIAHLRVKHIYRHLDLWAPRQICTDTVIRAAGISKKAVKVKPYEYQAEHWQSLRSALLTGNENRVIITNRTSHLRRLDKRRQHLPNGNTAPYRKEEEKCGA